MSLPNRLVHEHSLYLRQHAYNPVDWYPWGEEAFKKAREQDKPVFLSIGYAACHWCHVMEHTCFEDESVAHLLNAHFISIKVDREEHPDIDAIYMNVCQAMTGSGGWPLSLFLTPDKRPFYAATYIPRDSSPGMPGMLDILPYLADVWKTRKGDVHAIADQIITAILKHNERNQPGNIQDIVEYAAKNLINRYDPVHGGFSRAPKFPSVSTLMFLFRYSWYQNESNILSMIVKTLDQIAYGGIRDHLDGGFHRYATDNAWKLPHFEKMLYDQAMAVLVYTEAWQVTGSLSYKHIVISALEYMMHSLQEKEGGFYSSEDADSPGGEGAYYLWTYDEISHLCGSDAEIVCQLFHLSKNGNVSGVHGMKPGDNVLYPQENPIEKLKRLGISDPQEYYQKIIHTLRTARANREKPATDDKILTDWNSMAVWALAYAGSVFQIDRYIMQAIRTADFLFSTMVRSDGTVLHRWHDGDVGIAGTSSDYLSLSWSCMVLYQVTGDEKWFIRSQDLEKEASLRFYDHQNGGYFQTESLVDLPVRLKDHTDGPVPSVNGIAYLLLRSLGEITGDEEYIKKSQDIERYYAKSEEWVAYSSPSFLMGLCENKHRGRAVLMGDPKNPEYSKMWSELWSCFCPGFIRIPVRGNKSSIIKNILGSDVLDSIPKVLICARNQCYPPVTSVEKLQEFLRKSDVFKGDEVSNATESPDK
ncbi:thioredoxin domain-containing protein [Methanospirillum sp. J.3.6.1-F.2.7.3]|uniref:Thioredoxin domain-containing protein n=1 Tax=Methanospirillum purgamenti TaxID=2834276 RepID=A0A8E7AX54_9EURY|nr:MULTISPECIES: thioredoxin domain-containing protein [Methanospirillum]MDX8549397.1 thioredoxin domain-containing protein [Methanospirillum hungatei]QVV89317.1 thioredoxin domain-containing protein [Methanospirillum sp. J.3.6.1-F.2.7.3]